MISPGSSGTSGNLCFTKYQVATNTIGNQLVSTAKQYTRKTGQRPKHGWILFFGHGAGFCKELWEPTIEEIFRLDGGLHIREAWSLDAQNHGEAAAVNEVELSRLHERDPLEIGIYDFGDALAKLAKSEVLEFVPGKDKLAIVGHSAGAVGVVLATTFFSPPSLIPFDSIILIEPAMLSPSSEFTDSYHAIAAMTPLKRDIWDSRESALAWFKKRIPYALWDSRILELFTEHGLRPLPTLLYPSKTGVTLMTPKRTEAKPFTQSGVTSSFDALWRLAQISQYKNTEIHLVFGDRGDLYSRENQESISSVVRTCTSVRWLEDVGHLVVQESPSKVASAVFDILAKHGNQDDKVVSKL